MKRQSYDDRLHGLREQLRHQIDAAARAVVDALQAAADLFVAINERPTDPGIVPGKVETSRVSEMLTTQQAADYLGIKDSTLTVWRCRRTYEIPFVKVGSKVRYRKTDLDDFLKRRTKGAGGED
jgi:excisionase family DNA binding protein